MSASLVLPQSTTRTRHWRVALALGAAGAISVLLLMPYLLAMMPQLKARIPVPLPLFALLQTLQGGAVITCSLGRALRSAGSTVSTRHGCARG